MFNFYVCVAEIHNVYILQYSSHLYITSTLTYNHVGVTYSNSCESVFVSLFAGF